jgi:hypothetical protein
MPSMRLTTSPLMPCSGESNGSAALVTIRAFRATHKSAFTWRSFPPAKRIRSSARSRSSQTKRTVRIGVGLLPYSSMASVWQQRRPVITDLAASRHRLTIDTSSCRMVALGDVASVISRSSYLFGVSWPDVRRTLLVAVEQDGDPYAVMIPTPESVQAGIIKNPVSSAAPSHSATWKELERSGHGMAV